MHIFQFLHSLQLIPGYTSSVIHFLSSTQEVIAYWPNQSISRYVKQQRQECGGKEELVNSLDATTVTLNWEGNTIYTQSCGQISQISLHFSRCSVSLVIFLGQWLSSPPNGLGSHPPTLLQNESVVPASLLNIIVSKYMGRHRGPAPLYSYPETDLPSGISSLTSHTLHSFIILLYTLINNY